MSQEPPFTDYADAHEHELQMLKEATESTAAGQARHWPKPEWVQ